MIVLDTHVWLWLADEADRLSPPARAAVAAADGLAVSPISALEIATLVRRGRIALDRDVVSWIGTALAGERVMEAPLAAVCAARAGALDDSFPGDPADRIIYATALELRTQLVTADRALREFDPSRTVW